MDLCRALQNLSNADRKTLDARRYKSRCPRHFLSRCLYLHATDQWILYHRVTRRPEQAVLPIRSADSFG
jgi:hypothetical protein